MANGCISTTMYGTEVTEFLAPGASEGDVVMKHGAPDNIVYLGTPYYNPQTGERGEVGEPAPGDHRDVRLRQGGEHAEGDDRLPVGDRAGRIVHDRRDRPVVVRRDEQDRNRRDLPEPVVEGGHADSASKKPRAQR